jgi:hypothetical protein
MHRARPPVRQVSIPRSQTLIMDECTVLYQPVLSKNTPPVPNELVQSTGRLNISVLSFYSFAEVSVLVSNIGQVRNFALDGFDNPDTETHA